MVAKELGLAGIIVLTLLTIGCIGSNTTGTIECGSDKACFVNAIKNCSDSKVTISNDNTSFDIALSKVRDNLCRYQVTLTTSSKKPGSVGKSAVCEVYNSMSAAKAVNSSYYVSFPAESIYNDPSQLNTTVINVMLLFANCSGGLFDDIKAVINNKTAIDNQTEVKTCSDGTAYGQCSANKPKSCVNGELVDQCRWCGCSPENYTACNATTQVCFIPTCPGGTPYGQCDVHLAYCNPNMGWFSDSCSKCGCQLGLICDHATDRCYGSTPANNSVTNQSCSDGTPYNQCSTATRTKYCMRVYTTYEHGILTDNCGFCGGCLANETCNGLWCEPKVDSIKITNVYVSGNVCYGIDILNDGTDTLLAGRGYRVWYYLNNSITGAGAYLNSDLGSGETGTYNFVDAIKMNTFNQSYAVNITFGNYILKGALTNKPYVSFNCSPEST